MKWKSMRDMAAYPLPPPPFWDTSGKIWLSLKRHGAATIHQIFFKFDMQGVNRPRYTQIQQLLMKNELTDL